MFIENINNKKGFPLPMPLNNLKKPLVSLAICTLVIFFGPSSQASEDKVASLMPVILFLLEGDSADEIDMASASRFLMQATYGPTLDEITALTNSSYEAWIENQFALPVTNHIEYGLDIGFFRTPNTIFQGPVPGRNHRYSGAG